MTFQDDLRWVHLTWNTAKVMASDRSYSEPMNSYVLGGLACSGAVIEYGHSNWIQAHRTECGKYRTGVTYQKSPVGQIR